MNNNPAIVVSAYNRSLPLYRLLQSIANAKYGEDKITLVISLDKSDNQDVYALADSFEWKQGEKKIIKHTTHLGLKEHILTCGDLTAQYNSVIILEDDLLVSPYFYEYATHALEFYKEENSLAGISLYNYQVAESCFHPFKAIDDGTDVYFMQVASSWGQAWTSKQWNDFRNWFNENPELPVLDLTGASGNVFIPSYLKRWGKHSWKKHFIHYLVDTNKYFVFPRLSLATNFEEEGTNSLTKNVFHVVLQIAELKYSFQRFENSKSIYDAWFEIMPESLNKHTSHLSQYNYEVDLYGTKDAFQKKYVLTSQYAQNPIHSYSFELFPLETNVILDLNGTEINLYETAANSFEKRKLHLINFLEELNPNTDLSISIIIPIAKLESAQLIKTLDSIEQQAYPFCELILVITKNDNATIEKLIFYYTFNIKIIVSEFSQLDQQVLIGLNTSNNEIVSWIQQGCEFKTDSIKNINTILKSYLHINWVNGIQEHTDDKYIYDRLNVFDYRLAPIEIYKRAKAGHLSYSTQGHFFRNECVKSIAMLDFNLKKLFLHLMDNFQLVIVVKCLLCIDFEKEKLLLSEVDLNELVTKHKPELSIASVKAQLFNILLKLPLLGHKSYKWYYTSEHNFPDVLRYDFEKKCFYFNKF
jgi:hypothetical protein